jgi:hypothetical protein
VKYKYGNEMGGCFDRNALLRILDTIKVNNNMRLDYDANSSTSYLWHIIKKHMGRDCDYKDTIQHREMCWLNTDILKDDMRLEDYYKPRTSKNPYSLLSTHQIYNVLSQYEYDNKHFTFLGVVPIDFAEFLNEVSNFNICKNYALGKKEFGIVFNLDPHYKIGSHWVCMYICLKNNYIGYFDSGGFQPPPEIKNLIYKLQLNAYSCHMNLQNVFINHIQHQRTKYACGMYCIYVIHQCIQGHKMHDFVNVPISDEFVQRLRDFYFRPQS